jgi:hypothetical protein
MNPFFNWLKDTGTQAMMVLVGTLAAIGAVIGTFPRLLFHGFCPESGYVRVADDRLLTAAVAWFPRSAPRLRVAN